MMDLSRMTMAARPARRVGLWFHRFIFDAGGYFGNTCQSCCGVNTGAMILSLIILKGGTAAG